MQKFVSIPTEIHAEQFTDGNIPEGVAGDSIKGWYVFDSEQRGQIPCHYGDWIITGTEGERYPCSDQVFKKKYRSL